MSTGCVSGRDYAGAVYDGALVGSEYGGATAGCEPGGASAASASDGAPAGSESGGASAVTANFGSSAVGRSPLLPATLAQAKKAWKQVITVLGITNNDLRCMAAETDEEQLFGSDHEGSVHSDSSGYSDMPPLIPAWPTVESLGDEHPAFLYVTNSTDEGPSSTDSEAEAIEVTAGRQHHRSTAGRQPFHAALSSLHRQGMQVTADSSTDEPGSTYSGPGAVTGPSSYIMQVLDTHHHQAFSKLYLEQEFDMVLKKTEKCPGSASLS